jgi:hypothetical protein
MPRERSRPNIYVVKLIYMSGNRLCTKFMIIGRARRGSMISSSVPRLSAGMRIRSSSLMRTSVFPAHRRPKEPDFSVWFPMSVSGWLAW